MNKDDTMSGGNEDGSGANEQASGLTEQGRRETAQIEQEIAQTRAEMSGTLDQIHGKLNPTVLKEQAVDQFHEAKEKIKAEIKAELAEAKSAVREATVGKVEHMVHSTTDTVKQTGASFIDTVKRNPIPTAMVGVGAAWLLLRGRKSGPRGPRALERDVTYEPGGELGGDWASESGRDASRIRQVAGERMHAAREHMQGASDRMQRWKQDAQERGRQLEYRAESAFQENPLLVGAAVVAAGALVGLAIPITRREDTLMGKTRDGLVEQAQVRVKGALDKAQGAIERAAKTP